MIFLELGHIIDRIKEPIWGEIPISELEWRLIRTHTFSRLRHIRQMGVAYLSFPGANHTRYEHSMGTMQAATKILEITDTDETFDKVSILPQLRIAALLHDIGHPPFSHIVEELFRKYPSLLLDIEQSDNPAAQTLKEILGNSYEYSHEKFTKYLVQNDKNISKIIDGSNYSVEGIACLSVGEAEKEKLSPLNPIINGDIDADKIDYLLRDSYYCGLSHKFDINELRDKIVIEKTDKKFKYNMFLKPEAIPSVDVLLLARYKLIKEVQSEERNRIATQMLIEKIRIALESLKVDQRAEKILEMHLEMTNSEFEKWLEEQVPQNPTIKEILNGELYKQQHVFEFIKMPPPIRASFHTILSTPKYISSIQEQIRDIFGNQNLLLDIREPRPPKFSTLVKKDREPRNIFDGYYTPHGILIDSFNDLKVYIYGPEDNTLDDSIVNKPVLKKRFNLFDDSYFYFSISNSISKIIALISAETSKQIREVNVQQGKILDLDFLLKLFSSLENFNRASLKKKRLWIRTDTIFQMFTKHIMEDLKYLIEIYPAYNWEGKVFSVKLFRDLERLINMGFIDHIHKVGPYVMKSRKNKTKEIAGWRFRLDRRISGWGQRYVSHELKELYLDIQKKVNKRQEAVADKIREIIVLEEKVDALGGQILKRQELNRKIHALIEEVRKKEGCVFTLI